MKQEKQWNRILSPGICQLCSLNNHLIFVSLRVFISQILDCVPACLTCLSHIFKVKWDSKCESNAWILKQRWVAWRQQTFFFPYRVLPFFKTKTLRNNISHKNIDFCLFLWEKRIQRFGNCRPGFTYGRLGLSGLTLSWNTISVLSHPPILNMHTHALTLPDLHISACLFLICGLC